ncbi:MAG: hypothetical protein ACI81A_000311 [Paraglaciecola sp.]|jgi:hypothetical protein
MSQLPWVLYTDQSLEQGRFLGKLEWVSMYPSRNGCLCILYVSELEWVSMYPRTMYPNVPARSFEILGFQQPTHPGNVDRQFWVGNKTTAP